MSGAFLGLFALMWISLAACYWLGWQLLRQNGRILLRLDEIEKRLDELEFGALAEPESLADGEPAHQMNARPHPGHLPQERGNCCPP
jgi:hypothetical protein